MMSTAEGKLVVVSGFSGVGKGTVIASLLETHPEYALSVSATTRDPREYEIDGVHYHFISKDRFEQMIREDDLLEYASYLNNYYGTPKTFVTDNIAQGRDVLLEIEIQGARKVKAACPDALMLFVMPPSAQVLRERLVGRGSEKPEDVDARLRRAAREAEGIEEYDYILINDDICACAERMHSLIRAYHQKTSFHLDFIQEVRNDLINL